LHGAYYVKQFWQQSNIRAYYGSGNIVVQCTVRAGEDMKLLTKVYNVGRECEKCDKKEDKKKRFSFMN
jgi:hypothetical protein